MLTEDELVEDEYELQYYGFSSCQIYCDYYMIIQERIKQLLSGFETLLKETNNDNTEERIQKLRELYSTKVKEPLKKIQEEIRNIFIIIPTIKEQNNELIQPKNKELELLKAEIESLQVEYLREKLFLRKLEQQEENMMSLKDYYENTNLILKMTENILNKNQVNVDRELERTVEIHKKFVNLLNSRIKSNNKK